jgi:hypothetical protein
MTFSWIGFSALQSEPQTAFIKQITGMGTLHL